MSERIAFWVRVVSIGLLIIAFMAMGVEIFINNLDNIMAIKVWAIVALVCLFANAFALIYKLSKSGTEHEKAIAPVLAILLFGFLMIKLIQHFTHM